MVTKYSLETCVWLLFMLLEDFFASARPTERSFLPKSAVNYSYYLKLNNIIAQRKTTYIEKQFYLWFFSFI